MTDPVYYARLSGMLQAHLECAMADLEAALAVVPKFQSPIRTKIRNRVSAIKDLLDRHPVISSDDKESGL